MWGTSSNYPTICNYGDAKRTYENTKPLRGRPDFRPLDARSSRAKARIEKHGDEYLIRLYNTTIVTYRPDGSFFVQHGGWCTPVTAAAMSCMSPVTAWNRSGNFVVSDGRLNYAEGTRFVVERGGLEFKRGEDGNYVPVNPPVAKKWKTRVKREEARVARKYYAEVPKMIIALSSLLAGSEHDRTVVRPAVEIHDTPLTQKEISAMAMSFVQDECAWLDGSIKVMSRPGTSTQKFWRHVYAELDLHETYSTDLPYGEVPK